MRISLRWSGYMVVDYSDGTHFGDNRFIPE